MNAKNSQPRGKMKKYILICISNLEHLAIQEVKELIKKQPKILTPSRLILECSEKEIAELIYKTQSLIYIYELLEQGTIREIEDISKIAKTINFKKAIKTDFVVKCNREGEHPFKSINIEQELGAFIHDSTNIPVNLTNPTTTIFVDIKDKDCFIGIDLTGQKLSKRDYRIKLISNPLNPCIAYSLIRFANWNTKESLLDPFTKSGELVIEAALYALKISPQKHIKDKLLFTKLIKADPQDKELKKSLKIYASDFLMANIRNSEVNAKLAGVNKSIAFSRIEPDWLDTKFKASSVDKIITYPPQISQTHPIAQLENIYRKFFHASSLILKKSGSMVLLMNKNLELVNRYSAEFKFKTVKKLEFTQANQDYVILELKK